MTDMELAEQIERYLEIQRGDYFSVSYPRSKWQQILAALRRGHERPPSGEMEWTPTKGELEFARGIVAAEGFYTQAAITVAKALLRLSAAEANEANQKGK